MCDRKLWRFWLFLGLFLPFSGLNLPSYGAEIVSATLASYTPDPEITAQLASNPGLLQEKLEASMRKLLNNPKVLEITLEEKNASDSALGRVPKIVVKTENGEIDRLVLNKANFTFYDVNLDTAKLLREEKITTVSVGSITLDVIILESDLNAFLQDKAGKIKVDRPRAELEPGKITISGSTKYSFVKVAFWATGVFSVENSRSIFFHPKKLKVNGLGVPRSFIGSIVKRINPILNLDKFPFRVNLKDITIEKGSLHFSSLQ